MKVSFIKRAAIAVIVAVAMGAAVQAQTFTKGDNLFSATVGLGNGVYNSTYTSRIIPVSAYYEKCVKDNLFDEKSSIGVGGMVAYTGAKSEYTVLGNTYGFKHSNIILGARGALHYQFIDKLDTYAGLMLGYNIGSSSYYGDAQFNNVKSQSVSGFGTDLFLGARYYFSDTFAAMGEFGYGVAYLKVGVTFKF